MPRNFPSKGYKLKLVKQKKSVLEIVTDERLEKQNQLSLYSSTVNH
jgi:hypothetical protein